MPLINANVDFFNIMTYDLMNRRDNITKHHTDVLKSLEAVDTYLSRGIPPSKANLGFAFYVKWFRTDPNANCSIEPIGCKTELLENPETGADLGRAGAFSWHDEVPTELKRSFSRALSEGTYDRENGGYYYWDQGENVWWTFDTSEAILSKFPAIIKKRELGGVFAWGLGEDARTFKHLQVLTKGFDKLYQGNYYYKQNVVKKLEL